jgi:hypothetical protein
MKMAVYASIIRIFHTEIVSGSVPPPASCDDDDAREQMFQQDISLYAPIQQQQQPW